MFTRIRDQLHSATEFNGLLVRMELLAWAIFYLDDGSYTPEHVRPNGYTEHATVRISCPSFSSVERAAIGAQLTKTFDVAWTVCTWTNPRDPAAPYHGIRLYREHAARFLKALAPVIPKESGMLYKIFG